MNLNRLNSLGRQGEGDVRYTKKVKNKDFLKNLETNRGNEADGLLSGRKKPMGAEEDFLEFTEMVQKKFGYHYGVQQKIQFPHEAYPAGISSVAGTEFRSLEYGECDAVRVNVLEGYTLSVRQEEEGRYYVEVKYDTGRNAAYLVEADENFYESRQFAKQAEEFLVKVRETAGEKNDAKGQKTAPYSYLADASGSIVCNGVVFQCQYENNALTLGDMSNPDDVIVVYLSEGGCLKVNRNNINDLARAIGMFSPEDVRRIMDAISLYAKIQKKKNEIEEQETETVENM